MIVLVYVVDSLGFRGVFRPKTITYDDSGLVPTAAGSLKIPASGFFVDARGDDTLRVDLAVEDAIATDTRPKASTREGERGDPLGSQKARPFFIQMKGTARISGRLDGQALNGLGTGFFETYR